MAQGRQAYPDHHQDDNHYHQRVKEEEAAVAVWWLTVVPLKQDHDSESLLLSYLYAWVGGWCLGGHKNGTFICVVSEINGLYHII